MPLSKEKKEAYFEKLQGWLDTYSKIMLVQVDNVGSNQIQQIRLGMRREGKEDFAYILMGKNTLIRKIINEFIAEKPDHPIKELLPYIKGNVGMVFTNEDLNEVREKLESVRKPAPARVGSIAQKDVFVPPGATGCDPGQTSFFQVLGIPTKIQRGQIEIVSEVHLIHKGEKVGPSEAALLDKLNIRPFDYGLMLDTIYNNGSVFDPAVLDISQDDLRAKFTAGVTIVASLCLGAGYPTLASVPHSVANSFKNLVAVAVECEEFSFEKADAYKAYLADPSAFACASGGDSGGAAAEEKVEEVKEKEESEDMGGGMGMFGDDDGGEGY
jgi:large subunit ribosomal protein LP0